MKRATPIVFLVLVIAWVAGPFLYRASWALTGAPVATRTVYPLPSITPEKVRVFHFDTTQTVPPERLPHPNTPFVLNPKHYEKCRPSRPDPRARIIVLGVGRGDALSTVALAGGLGATGVVDLIVEPGVQPLYLVLSSSENVIWRLTGATGRLSRVVLLAASKLPSEPDPNVIVEFHPQPIESAGVTGVPANRVTMLSREVCPRFEEYPNADRMQRGDAVARHLFGGDPVVMAGGPRVSAVRLPSGLAATLETREDAARLQAGAVRTSQAAIPAAAPARDPWHGDVSPLSEWPGGLVSIRSEDIVSPLPTQSQDLLPGSMGIRQMAEAGDIRVVEHQSGVEIQVRRPVVRLPSSSSMGTAFVLEPLVPVPVEGGQGRCVRRRIIAGLPFTYRISPAFCDW